MSSSWQAKFQLLIIALFLLTSLLHGGDGCTKKTLRDDRDIKELFLFFGHQLGEPEPVRPILKKHEAHGSPCSLYGHFVEMEDGISSHRVVSGLAVIFSSRSA